MRIKFNRQIRLLACLERFEEGHTVEQEWEFDENEVLEVYDIIWDEPRKFRAGKKLTINRLCDIFLNQGTNEYPDYLHWVPGHCFEILD